jgi:cysteinyl-tRNA synthetase
MSVTHLGQPFDIHTGGVDLVFPHHEDEIAQSEAATGKPFVRFWLHNAHLQMGGQKMAKRDGNIERPADIYARGFSPRALRYALLAVQYRAPLEFGEESLQASAAATDRLSRALAALDAYREEAPDDPSLPDLLAGARTRFAEALDDDLNVSAALAAVFDLVRDLNRRMEDRRLSTADASRAAAALRDLDQVLAVMDEDADAGLSVEEAALLEQRSAARAARDWAASDRLRDELVRRGILVEDTRDGQRWRRAGEADRAAQA